MSKKRFRQQRYGSQSISVFLLLILPLEAQSTLFRDNTAGTQLFSAYCKIKGCGYLENILAVYLERLMYRREAIEIDPCRCSDEAAENNTTVLHELVNEMLDRIFVSQPEFPQ